MLDELVKQVKRLFSSKNNGGRQVLKLTDRLHTHKQILLALSIVLLLGSANFREHFSCQGVDQVDKKILDTYCLINGTTTVIQGDQDRPSPHVGLGYAISKDQKVINHNYIRSLWVLLILLAICSYFPQRLWASIFQNDTLQALLQLPGSEKSRLAEGAKQAKLYEILSGLPRDLKIATSDMYNRADYEKLSPSDKLMCRIEIVDKHLNTYDCKLDYYPNQLIYLLLTTKVSAYKTSRLDLRGKLIRYSIWSTFFTSLQFLLPITFLGDDYIVYGWEYAIQLLNYLKLLLDPNRRLSDVSSIDYNLSASIFPIITQCRYNQHAITGGFETANAICTVAINEICGKVFAIFWWFVVINLFIEFWSLLIIIISSFHYKLTSSLFGSRFWPAAHEQADLIASFRYKKLCIVKQAKTQALIRKHSHLVLVKSGKKGNHEAPLSRLDTNGLEQAGKVCKKLESEADSRKSGIPNFQDQRRPAACVSGFFTAIIKLITSILCCLTKRRRRYYDEEDKKDINIYYLLYLMYLRLGRSRSQVEEVIRMTSSALERHLKDLHDKYDKVEKIIEGDSGPSSYSSEFGEFPRSINLSEEVEDKPTKLNEKMNCQL